MYCSWLKGHDQWNITWYGSQTHLDILKLGEVWYDGSLQSSDILRHMTMSNTCAQSLNRWRVCAQPQDSNGSSPLSKISDLYLFRISLQHFILNSSIILDIDIHLQMTFPFSNMVMFQPSDNSRSINSASTATSEASDVSDTAARWHPHCGTPTFLLWGFRDPA